MKALTENELDAFLRTLLAEYGVFAPVALLDGTRVIRNIEEGPLALAGGRVSAKPLGMFFPQYEEILTLETEGRGFPVAGSGLKPAARTLIAGLTAEDADALEFTDRFFAANYRDQPYFRKRDGAAIAVVSGRCGANGEFLRIAGGKCDLELVSDGSVYLAVPYSSAGQELEARMPEGASSDALDSLKKESDALPNEERAMIQKTSELLRAQAVPDAFWEEVASRCIACTACNMVCPTCTCFDIVDIRCNGLVHRHRLWDSCQLDGFAREASGRNPMGTEGLRTRRRIHHKLAADPEHWGHSTCFLCGRCDDVCPSGIGMKSVAREIVKRFGAAAATAGNAPQRTGAP